MHTNDYKKYMKSVKKLLGKYKDIRWLFCHLGSFNWLATPGDTLADSKDVFKNIDDFVDIMSNPNVWTDIAALTFCYDEPYPYPTAIKLLKRLIKDIGVKKIMFATDWPWTESYCTYRQAVDMICNADYLSEEQKNKLLGENAATYLKI